MFSFGVKHPETKAAETIGKSISRTATVHLFNLELLNTTHHSRV